VTKKDKKSLLVRFLREEARGRVIVFARTKHGADKLHRDLAKAGIDAAAIHGNKSQSQRERALSAFKSPRPPVLVATDIAARGIDVDDVAHVINYELPHEPETYVHRIGRTGRAGQSGVAVSFCDAEERSRLVAIERLLRRSIPTHDGQPAPAVEAAPAPAPSKRSRPAPRQAAARPAAPRVEQPATAPATPRVAAGRPGQRRHRRAL
jgi:ATP-dependent RNA helicase RhlE